MLVYPQLATGAITQFPIHKRHRVRTIMNTAADGSTVKLEDPGAEWLEWRLNYRGISDSELEALLLFHAAAEGTLNTFTFLDPTANLLAWSGAMDNPVWNSGPFLSMTGEVTDPLAGNDAWHVINAGAAAQTLSQTAAAPGDYLYCFSSYVRSPAPGRVTLLLGDSRSEQVTGPDWKRIACASLGTAGTESIVFGIEMPAGGVIDIYGAQAEPQASPSAYKASTRGG